MVTKQLQNESKIQRRSRFPEFKARDNSEKEDRELIQSGHTELEVPVRCPPRKSQVRGGWSDLQLWGDSDLEVISSEVAVQQNWDDTDKEEQL